MKKQPDKTPIKRLSDAYKVSGFRVSATVESYDDLKHPAFVITLDRRSKKRCAVDAGKFAVAFTTNAGDVPVISVAGIEKSISIFPCVA